MFSWPTDGRWRLLVVPAFSPRFGSSLKFDTFVMRKTWIYKNNQTCIRPWFIVCALNAFFSFWMCISVVVTVVTWQPIYADWSYYFPSQVKLIIFSSLKHLNDHEPWHQEVHVLCLQCASWHWLTGGGLGKIAALNFKYTNKSLYSNTLS